MAWNVSSGSFVFRELHTEPKQYPDTTRIRAIVNAVVNARNGGTPRQCERVYLRLMDLNGNLLALRRRVFALDISADLSASEGLGERGQMYKEVYVPVDNSDYSNQACV